MNTQNIFFDTEEYSILHASEVRDYAFLENLDDNLTLAERAAEELFNTSTLTDFLVKIFSNPAEVEKIKHDTANTLADEFLEECRANENDRFVPVDDITDAALCEIEECEDKEIAKES